MNNRTYPPIHKALKKYYGYDEFRPGQIDLICALLDGRDVLGIMPTGAGKSVCYQIPAVFLPGITLVISPLISLMKDQVAALNQAGIPAAFLNSSLNSGQYRKALYFASQGRYKIIYVAPERLLTPAFLNFAQSMNISMIAVDEAHCVSQWGQNFRPSYLDIAEFAQKLPKRPILAAFTATATGPVKDDILHMLNLKDPKLLVTGFDRPNLYFEVQQPRDKMKAIQDYLEEHPGQSGIIYCQTRKETEEVAQALCEAGFPCTRYHAGLDDTERSRNQDEFQFDRVPLIAATSAFGMGINKSNVRFVIHYSLPQSLENYYQEAGRAGRDGAPAECILLFAPADIMVSKFLIERSNEDNPDQELRDLHRLNQMVDYCKTTACLRATILAYFGETSAGTCDNCSNCKGEWEDEDISQEAAKISKAIDAMPRAYGLNTVRDFLAGASTKKIREAYLDHVEGYGSLKNLSKEQIASLLESLIMKGYLQRSSDRWQVIYGSRKLREDLKKATLITMRRLKRHSLPEGSRTGTNRSASRSALSNTSRSIASSLSSPGDSADAFDTALFDRLRQKRLELAKARGLPPYIIFSDATLMAMAREMPLSEDEFMAINGVGQIKFERYGKAFLGVIQDFLSEDAAETGTDTDN